MKGVRIEGEYRQREGYEGSTEELREKEGGKKAT